MHVDVLRLVLGKFRSSLSEAATSTLMSTACCPGSVDVVQELLDHHQEKFGGWTVNDFDAAALRGNVPMLQLLSLARYGGCKKLAETPQLNRICTGNVLKERNASSTVMLMLCVKWKT